MEETIKILEEIKTMDKWVLGTRERQALENLIKGYRELEYKYNKALTDLSIEAKRTNEENYRCSLFAVENNDLKEKLDDSIPKSKIKEKIEPVINSLEKDGFVGYADELRDILQELMEDK